MRILFILAIIFFIISCDANKKPADCSRFKKGRFLLKDKINRTNYIIDRNDSAQFELNENTDTVTVMRIKWVNECEYELRHEYQVKFMGNDQPPGQAVAGNIDTFPLKVRITATGKNYYAFNAKTDRFDFIYSDTMWQYNKAGGFKPVGEIFTGE